MASRMRQHPEAWPTEERVFTVDEIRISPAGDGFYAAASEANHTHAEQTERDCFFCLEGWVFFGSTAILIRVDPAANSQRGRTNLPHLRS